MRGMQHNSRSGEREKGSGGEKTTRPRSHLATRRVREKATNQLLSVAHLS